MPRVPQKLGLLTGLACFSLVWLCVRFPYEARNAAEKLLRISPEVDPLSLHLKGEFVESNLGTAVDPDESVTVRLIAQQYDFVPRCLLVPERTSIDFRITSADAVHRFAISGTSDAVEVVPGHISELREQFATPGEYTTPCHEFCGAGHYNMLSRIVVVRRDLFPRLKPDERANCAKP
jgi:cytochrome c oxidase subunit 2